MTQEKISEVPAEGLKKDGAGQAEVMTDVAAAAAVPAVAAAGAGAAASVVEENKESESQKPAVLEAMEKKEEEQVEQKELQEGDNRGSIEEPDESLAGQGLKLSESVEAAASDPAQVKHPRNIPSAAPPLGHLTCLVL